MSRPSILFSYTARHHTWILHEWLSQRGGGSQIWDGAGCDRVDGQETPLSTQRPNTFAQICRSTLRFFLAVRGRTIHSRNYENASCTRSRLYCHVLTSQPSGGNRTRTQE